MRYQKAVRDLSSDSGNGLRTLQGKEECGCAKGGSCVCSGDSRRCGCSNEKMKGVFLDDNGCVESRDMSNFPPNRTKYFRERYAELAIDASRVSAKHAPPAVTISPAKAGLFSQQNKTTSAMADTHNSSISADIQPAAIMSKLPNAAQQRLVPSGRSSDVVPKTTSTELHLAPPYAPSLRVHDPSRMQDTMQGCCSCSSICPKKPKDARFLFISTSKASCEHTCKIWGCKPDGTSGPGIFDFNWVANKELCLGMGAKGQPGSSGASPGGCGVNSNADPCEPWPDLCGTDSRTIWNYPCCLLECGDRFFPKVAPGTMGHDATVCYPPPATKYSPPDPKVDVYGSKPDDFDPFYNVRSITCTTKSGTKTVPCECGSTAVPKTCKCEFPKYLRNGNIGNWDFDPEDPLPCRCAPPLPIKTNYYKCCCLPQTPPGALPLPIEVSHAVDWCQKRHGKLLGGSHKDMKKCLDIQCQDKDKSGFHVFCGANGFHFRRKASKGIDIDQYTSVYGTTYKGWCPGIGSFSDCLKEIGSTSCPIVPQKTVKPTLKIITKKPHFPKPNFPF